MLSVAFCSFSRSANLCKPANLRMKKVLLTVLFLLAKTCNSATSIGRLGTMLLPFGEELHNRSKRATGIPNDNLLWPNRIVLFMVEASISSTVNATIYKAFQHIRSRTCINFTPRATEKNYISILYDQGCYSSVGYTKGRQPVSLGNGCDNLNIILAELMRALGFYYEHQRSDRDDYVQIIGQNIIRGSKEQFLKLSPSQNRLLTDFDYESVTLFGEKTFSKDGKAKTMTSKRGNKLVDVEMKKGLSQGDIAGINKLYKCK